MRLINTKRLLLSELRGGDYAHPGDTVAIDFVLDMLERLNPQFRKCPILDVGCGFGGSLNYMTQKGCHTISGVDIDTAAITHAKQHYQTGIFHVLDALALNTQFPHNIFSTIVMFSAAYAIENKKGLFEQIASVSQSGAILVLFDYASQDTLSVNDFAGKPIHPLNLISIANDLHQTGWELREYQNLTDKFIEWYQEFLDKLDTQYVELEKRFTKEDIQTVHQTFSYFLTQLREKKMFGALICAHKL